MRTPHDLQTAREQASDPGGSTHGRNSDIRCTPRHIAAITATLISLTFTPTGVTATGENTSVEKVPANEQAWQYKYLKWMPQHWINLARCESGSRGEPNWQHHSFYEGAFGFAPGSWDQFKLASWWPDAAYLATPWQQFATAKKIAARFGIAEPWGCWRGPQHAWVRNGKPEYGTYR